MRAWDIYGALGHIYLFPWLLPRVPVYSALVCERGKLLHQGWEEVIRTSIAVFQGSSPCHGSYTLSICRTMPGHIKNSLCGYLYHLVSESFLWGVPRSEPAAPAASVTRRQRSSCNWDWKKLQIASDGGSGHAWVERYNVPHLPLLFWWSEQSDTGQGLVSGKCYWFYL